MQAGYLLEKFNAAVSGLATSAASIQDRLFNVGVSNLVSVFTANDFPADFPGDLRQHIEELGARMTSEADTGDGSLRATTSKLSNAEGEAIAEEIWWISYQLRSYRDEKLGH